MNAAIEAHGLRKRYKGHQALDGVDLTVESGTVFGLLGPNGAGKTTTVRILTTLLRPDEGRASVAGYDVVRQANDVRARIGLTGQYAAVDERLTARENLILVGRLYRLGKRVTAERTEALLERFELTEAANRPLRTYSGGMRRRLDLAASLIGRPPLLFLDEPTTGLDPSSRLALWDMIREQVAAGVTILLTTQYLDEADQLAGRIAVLDEGKVIADGTPDQLKRKVGGEWLEVTVNTPAEAHDAVRALSSAIAGEPTVSEDGLKVSAPVADGMRSIAAIAERLDSAGVEVVDFALRRPSLDDVFLTLIGKTAAVREPQPA
ncbi:MULTISPECIES: ATP-binding cassette domain-containing protein [unclassified Streptomyces]|uniref:ATP-binding cassette domain-containing protein n=1 Tax=unclassified Streptomyces TaxID=2593676 RepID=UPI0011E86628|nr:ATP-binding cassette domain-containing protein [Streptomyces sp. sk2.1]TXS67095.1 ATP-binding cassette domain-containing protein [Streptomyces sp. sk2.1]